MAGPNILLVDDDADTCASLSDILTDLGYGVGMAYDGRAALELVVQDSFRLALLDYRMPGMDGLELYRRIRQLRAEIQGILVTAFAKDETLTEATEVGFRHVVPKPVDLGRLIPLIEECVGQPS